MVDIESLIAQLEEGLADQERHIRAEAYELLIEQLESTQNRLAQLASTIGDGVPLTAAQRVRLEVLGRKAQMLQDQAESVVADLKQKLSASARDRQGLASYRSAQQWPDSKAAFLNQKG